MARRSSISIVQAIALFCCLCFPARSEIGEIRELYSSRIQAPSLSCLNTTNASDSFLNHLSLLLSDFIVKSSLMNYYKTSIGHNRDAIYGYFMCRADISHQLCNSCILTGTRFASAANCEYTDGILFSELCVFRYSNDSIYASWNPFLHSKIDYLEANVSDYQLYNRTLSPTLEAVVEEAAFGTNESNSGVGFATREADVAPSQTIYSLAQCTPDILGTNCSRCLHLALSFLRPSADGAPAAISITPNCQLRYDNISFYHLKESNFSNIVRSPDLQVFYSVVFLIVYCLFA